MLYFSSQRFYSILFVMGDAISVPELSMPVFDFWGISPLLIFILQCRRFSHLDVVKMLQNFCWRRLAGLHKVRYPGNGVTSQTQI